MSIRSRWQHWFFRNTSAEPSPIILDRRRVYILPTGGGLLYAVVLVAMYVGAINYNLGLGHALVFLLAGLALVGMMHTYRNLAGLELSPRRTDPVFAGEDILYRFGLRNPGNHPRFAVQLAAGPCRTEAPIVRATDDIAIDVAVPSLRRGRQAIGRMRIRTRFPLGLYEAWSYPFPDAEALVFPRPILAPLPAALPSPAAGDAPGKEGEDDFAGFRTRQPSDSPRHVAWKAFARDPEHQPLLVMTFAGGARPDLWLDWNSASIDADVETTLSRLCGWVLTAERDGLRYGLRIPGTTIPPGQGAHHRECCLERLALFEAPRSPS